MVVGHKCATYMRMERFPKFDVCEKRSTDEAGFVAFEEAYSSVLATLF